MEFPKGYPLQTDISSHYLPGIKILTEPIFFKINILISIIDKYAVIYYNSFILPPWVGMICNKEKQMHNKETFLKRLKIAEGHIGGIERMVEGDAYCIDVLRQIQAVQAALNKISVGILEDQCRE